MAGIITFDHRNERFRSRCLKSLGSINRRRDGKTERTLETKLSAIAHLFRMVQNFVLFAKDIYLTIHVGIYELTQNSKIHLYFSSPNVIFLNMNIFRSFRNRLTYLMNQVSRHFTLTLLMRIAQTIKAYSELLNNPLAKKEEFSFPNYRDKSKLANDICGFSFER